MYKKQAGIEVNYNLNNKSNTTGPPKMFSTSDSRYLQPSKVLPTSDQPKYHRTPKSKKVQFAMDSKVWKKPQVEKDNVKGRVQPSPGNQVLQAKCTCNRPKRTVWCRMCGFQVAGNIKQICPAHPQRIFLYELEICGNPKCKAPNTLIEIDLF